MREIIMMDGDSGSKFPIDTVTGCSLGCAFKSLSDSGEPCVCDNTCAAFLEYDNGSIACLAMPHITVIGTLALIQENDNG